MSKYRTASCLSSSSFLVVRWAMGAYVREILSTTVGSLWDKLIYARVLYTSTERLKFHSVHCSVPSSSSRYASVSHTSFRNSPSPFRAALAHHPFHIFRLPSPKIAIIVSSPRSSVFSLYLHEILFVVSRGNLFLCPHFRNKIFYLKYSELIFGQHLYS